MNRAVIAAAALAGVLAACNSDAPPPEDQATGSIDSAAWEQARNLPPGVREALDSGNVAFREDRYDDARTFYLRATELGPQESAGWFGLSMVERQLGNIEAAEAAMQRVQELAPGASLVHPDTTAGADSLPPGHP